MKIFFTTSGNLFDNSTLFAKVAELVDALDLGSSGVTCESSSLSFRTICNNRRSTFSGIADHQGSEDMGVGLAKSSWLAFLSEMRHIQLKKTHMLMR